MIVDLLLVLVALAAALGLMVVGGVTLAAILFSERPGSLLSDPAARRSALAGHEPHVLGH